MTFPMIRAGVWCATMYVSFSDRVRWPVLVGTALVAVSIGGRCDAQTLRAQIRPLGSPSRVDEVLAANRGSTDSPKRDAGPIFPSNIRLTQFEVPAGPSRVMPTGPGQLGLPPGSPVGNIPPNPASGIGASVPPAAGLSRSGASTGLPQRANTDLPPSTMAASPSLPLRSSAVAVPTTNDLTPLSTPSLVPNMATLGNSCHVSPPSSYSASMASGCGGCGVVPYPATTVAPPIMGGPAVPSFGTPAAVAPGVPLGGVISGVDRAGPLPPLFTLGQQNYPVRLGQGWYGQPTAYVDGQGFRNFIRYLSP